MLIAAGAPFDNIAAQKSKFIPLPQVRLAITNIPANPKQRTIANRQQPKNQTSRFEKITDPAKNTGQQEN
jgi:hypothetical protein